MLNSSCVQTDQFLTAEDVIGSCKVEDPLYRTRPSWIRERNVKIAPCKLRSFGNIFTHSKETPFP